MCWAWLSTNYSITNAQNLDPTQVYTTGNVVLNTPQGGPTPWVNGVYQNSLTCWSWGDPGYCGPNAIVRPGNNINFSFGTTNLYQTQQIANLLPDSGSGLRVNGYNFGFTAKNGNGWDNGGLDYLTAYVNFYDPKGSTVFNKNYNLNYQFNWTTFNYSENFTTPFATKDLGSVQYGFVGRDNNYWAGPYGPEVTNVNFSLKYSVDPCFVNVLSSPSCPGYLDALAKLSPQPSTSTITEPITSTSVVSITPTSTSITNTTNSVSSTVDVQPTSSGSTTSSPTTVSSTTSSTSVTPTATNPQPKVGEVQVTGSQPSSSKSSVSTSQILSIVSNEQSRIGKLETSTANASIEQAKQDAAKVTADAQQVAATQQAQTLTQAQSVISSATPTQTQSPTSVSASQSSGMGLNLFAPQTSVVNASGLRGPDMYSLTSSNNISGGSNIASLSPIVNFNLRTEQEANKFSIQETPISENKQMFNQTNPLNSSMNPTPTTPTMEMPQPATAVNRNTKDNDLAGGISIASIAKQPQGFESYMNGLRDRPFYEVKEIYRNQTIVDNARAQRLLSGASDRLHQQMVDQQYNNNKGN